MSILLSAALVRLAPGWDTDELALDSRVSNETLARRTAGREGDKSLLRFSFDYTRRLLRGDLGWSVLFERPCSELVRDRVQVTFRMVAAGVFFGSLGALALAGLQVLAGTAATQSFQNLVIAVLLSIPAPLLGLAAAILGVAAEAAIFFIVFPRMLQYANTILSEHKRAGFVMSAHAHGVPPWRILLVHIFPVSLPTLAAFCGALVPVTLSAAVPVEVAADIPGLGQLAWKATIGRDVPLLLAVTLVITATSVIANAAAQVASARTR